MSGRVELGCPGHFIGAEDCDFRRHTQVPGYRISTVGDFFYSEQVASLLGKTRERQPLGADPESFFETMVFETTDRPAKGNEGCGCMEVKDYTELDAERYSTAGEAQEGHERLVRKYETMARAE